MVKVLVMAVAGVASVALVPLAVLVVGMRTRSPLVLDAVRRFNRRVTNPRVMRRAGTAGPYGVVHHVGRRSGRAYETPVEPIPTEHGFIVVLPYGTRADWLRNVLAVGGATITLAGETVSVTAPEVVPTAAVVDQLPDGQRRTLRIFGVDECLRLSLGSAA